MKEFFLKFAHEIKGLAIHAAFLVSLLSCSSEFSQSPPPVVADDSAGVPVPDSLPDNEIEVIPEEERKLIESGLVNVQDYDSTIQVDLRYASENNFLKKNLYGNLAKCYLQKDVAEKLMNAQKLLKAEFPSRNLLVFDGVRPRSVQWKMWNILEMPDSEKVKYVSNPKFGSLHNFGAAVDLTITDENGMELDMGTPYDYFGELAYPVKEREFLKTGELTVRQVENRRLLRRVMYGSGFFNIQTEWWHFNSCYRKEAVERYSIIE